MPTPQINLLLCHPGSHCVAIERIEASAAFMANGSLILSYRLDCDPAGIRLPSPASPAAADKLWQHTCCEAFIGAAGSPEYREFNFSPSGQWAAYRFADYRRRDDEFQPPCPPTFTCQRLANSFRLDAALAPGLLPAAASLRIGLTAVIEAADDSKSYWALAHGASTPDFHLSQSFTLALDKP